MNTCANVSTVESVVLRGKSIERLYGSILWKFVLYFSVNIVNNRSLYPTLLLCVKIHLKAIAAVSMVFCSNIHNCMKFLVMLIYINEIKKVASPHPNDFYWANKTYLRAIVIFIETQFWSNIFLLSKNIGYIIVQSFTCHNRQSFSKVLYLHFKHSLFF